MANLNYTNAIANGQVADGDKLMVNYNNVKTFLEGGNLDHANLAYPRSIFEVGRTLLTVNATSGTPETVLIKVPVVSAVPIEPICGHLCVDSIDSANNVNFRAYSGTGTGTPLFAAIQVTASDAGNSQETMAVSSIAAGGVIRLDVWVDSNSSTNVTFGVWFRAKHVGPTGA